MADTTIPTVTGLAEHLTARIELLHIQNDISWYTARNLRSYVYLDRSIDAMVYGVEKRLLAGDTENEAREVRYPADWMEHLKYNLIQNTPWWLPTRFVLWLHNRHPVKYMTVTVPCGITRMCPHVDIPDEVSTHLDWLRQVKTKIPYDAGPPQTMADVTP